MANIGTAATAEDTQSGANKKELSWRRTAKDSHMNDTTMAM